MRNPYIRHSPLFSALVGLCLGVLIFWGLVESPVTQIGDSEWSIPLAVSILREGDLDLNEFAGQIRADDARIEKVGEDFLYYFPYGPSVFAAPFVAVAAIFQPALLTRPLAFSTRLEVVIASLFVALTSLLLYAIARQQGLSITRASLLTLLFAFGTSAWSTASRALWQHGPSMFLLTLTLFLVLRAKKRPAWVVYASIPLALSFVVRPTNSLSVLALSLWVFVCYRPYFWRFCVLGLSIALLFLAVNLHEYHTFLPPYFLPERVGHRQHLVEALLANLVSPGRGLIVYTPVVLLSLYAAWLRAKSHRLGALDISLLAVLGAHWVLISSFPRWWAGWSFGPRLFTDVFPYFWYFLIGFFQEIEHTAHRKFLWSACAVLALWGVFVHGRGALEPATFAAWSARPVNVDLDQGRIWDWYDPPFLRNFTLADRLIPAELRANPSSIFLYRPPGSEQPLSFRLVVENMHHRATDWKLEASDGVRLLATNLPESYMLEITAEVTPLVEAASPPPQSIKVTAQGYIGSTTINVPVIVVSNLARSLYLPIVSKGQD